VLKANGGQASAFNAGFRASRGDVVLFLDSDDILLPDAIEGAIPRFAEGGYAKVHWPLRVIDGQGQLTGQVLPEKPLSDGDLRAGVAQEGPDGYVWPPTSGNLWARHFLEAVLPMPEAEFRTCPDYYLGALVPLYGRVGLIPEPLGLYRVHGGNQSLLGRAGERLEVLGRRFDYCMEALRVRGRALGLSVDPEASQTRWWLNWLRRINRAVETMDAALPPEGTCILADEGQWENHEIPMPRRCLPFTERHGQYWGPPNDDADALREFERLRLAGGEFLVVGWPAFWWLQHYRGFHRHLRERFAPVLENDDLIIFDLRATA
jgi:hypothetical protein